MKDHVDEITAPTFLVLLHGSSSQCRGKAGHLIPTPQGDAGQTKFLETVLIATTWVATSI